MDISAGNGYKKFHDRRYSAQHFSVKGRYKIFN